MSESKGPRPVAWQVGAFGAWSVHSSVHLSDDDLASGVSTVVTPAEAEARAHAIIMAAAVARGEPAGYTAALNRVSVALGHGHITADHGSRRTSLIGLQDERSRVVGALVDAGIMAHGGDTAEGVRSLVAERDRLRRDCDAAAEACGVAVVGYVPEAWRMLSEARDEAVAERDTARKALAAVRDALGVVGNGSPMLAAESLREEVDALRASVSELREDLAAAEAARAEAVREAARLRVELGEVREAAAAAARACGVLDVEQVPDACDAAKGALDAGVGETVGGAARRVAAERDRWREQADFLRMRGKIMHDAAAEVVAPLREAIRDSYPAVDEWSPSDLVRVCHGLLWSGPKPTREPMTHTSLASIEQHGVVVGDRLEWPEDDDGGAMYARVRTAGFGVRCDGKMAYKYGVTDDESWPLTVVEAPDAD